MSNKNCKNCTRPLEVTVHTRRTKKFCSDGCRTGWHNKRRLEGLELLRERTERDERYSKTINKED